MAQHTLRSADQLIERAKAIAHEGRKKRVAVAAAQDVDVIGAVAQAQADGFIAGVLVGDIDSIRELADQHHIDLGKLELVDQKNVTEAAHAAADLAAHDGADLIMKGFLPTSALLKTVLDKRHNLRATDTLSHCAVLDIPGYHKLLNFTDGGMVVKPDVRQKLAILENAVLVGRALGCNPVKVALSGAVNTPEARMPHTLTDREEIIPEVARRMKDVLVQAPVTFDVAVSPDLAAVHRVEGGVAGDADVFLVDSIEECNIVVKSLIHFAATIFAGVIVGARVPVSLVSRTDTVMNKKASLALACVLADYYQQSRIWDQEGV